MQDESRAAASRRVALASTASAPFVFEVGVAGADPGGTSRSFVVTGTDPATGSSGMREYRLPDTQHNTYLDFLENLARDVRTRVTGSRRRNRPLSRRRFGHSSPGSCRRTSSRPLPP